MRNISTIIVNAVNTGDATGLGINTGQWVSASFQVIMGDVTAEGTVKLQASNDLTSQITTQPTNWSDIPNATSAIAAGLGPMITIPNMAYQWVRAVFTNTTVGTTTIIVKANGLSI